MKLEINNKRKAGKSTNMWKVNKTLLNNESEGKKRKLKIKTNENGNTTYQILWDEGKAVLRGKFIAINSYIKKFRNISKKPPPNFYTSRN